ncbi:MAG: tRNA nucleotidyltransferase, partial [Dehalococcoidia bacterium]|nr:tRNA nucleotidyltransferase [Dehalococcoidia bacterium]
MAGAALKLSPEARRLLADLAAFLRERVADAYVVGGCLRDALLGREGHDIDLAVEGDTLALGRDLAGAWGGHFFPLDEEAGLARVLLPQRSAQIDLQPLRGTIEEDLLLRDFTIDAMAARLAGAASGRAAVIDPTGGQADLRRRLVRVVAEDAFRADPLRPLRGARLAVELGFTVEPDTADLIRRHASGPATAAAERRREELMRIMATARAGEGLRLLDDLGLLEQILPQVT